MTTYIPALTIPYGVFANPAASVLLPIGLGAGIGYSTRPKVQEKQTQWNHIKEAPGRPPPWVFGPAWTCLYGLMGYAAHRAITNGLSPITSTPELIRATKHSATLYTVQLALNMAWMPLYFGLKRPIEATVDIVALLGVNVYLTKLWWSIDRTAAYCMFPYLGWLSFATYLCAGAGYLNGWSFQGKEVRSSRTGTDKQQ
ncbi:hypothetical protein N0V93_003924 [Gnomoniopsis smithogilvyi]|uniref:Translocator protein n=1 Tax=Gnomoniopsis smithogilvyi TaxID=1191159 RepID=A0A9W9CZ36_9PEZI|nr:hypothetical protein N0V93_003924 [Gnomoniopsis smithogilvyi]